MCISAMRAVREEITNISNRIGNNMVSVMFVLLTIGGAPVGLVLVFAATRKEMALLHTLSVRLVGTNTENKMSNFSTYKSKSKKSKNELFEMSHILIYLATF